MKGINKSILLVDDEKDILDFLSYNFSKKGFDVHTAANAMEGIEMANEFNPDIIIADIRMPVTNGIEMCRIIKKNELTKDIPVLFLTADSDEYLALSAHYAGGVQYINKPVPVNLILTIVNDILIKK